MKLNELRIHKSGASAIGQRLAVARADQAIGRRLVDAAQAARGHDHRLGTESLQLATANLHGQRTVAGTVFDNERSGKPFLVDAYACLQQLFMQHVQQDLAGDVGHVAGAGESGAAEGPLSDATVIPPAEDGAHALQLNDVSRRFFAEDLDGILIPQVVAPLHSVEGMLLPGIVLAQGGIDASLSLGGMAPDGMNLGQDSHIDTLAAGFQGRPHSC